MSTFVSVGNAAQPFRRLLDAVARVASELPQPVFVQSGSTPLDGRNCETATFLSMQEFERRVAQSELLIMHAGAGSVITAVRAGKVPVVMPRRARDGEHVDDHQCEFARALGERVVVIDEPKDLLAGVREALARQERARPSTSSPAVVAMVAAILRERASGAKRSAPR